MVLHRPVELAPFFVHYYSIEQCYWGVEQDDPGNGFSFNNYVPCAVDHHLAHDMQCAFPASSVEDMKHDVPDEP